MRALAGLSRYANVIITTHSILVLDEISNLVRLNKLSGEEKKELGYEEWEGLSPDDVGIYLFTANGEITPVEVFEDGLEESELDRVVLEIANLHSRVEGMFERHVRRNSGELQAQE
jgi:hypothetical protein